MRLPVFLQSVPPGHPTGNPSVVPPEVAAAAVVPWGLYTDAAVRVFFLAAVGYVVYGWTVKAAIGALLGNVGKPSKRKKAFGAWATRILTLPFVLPLLYIPGVWPAGLSRFWAAACTGAVAVLMPIAHHTLTNKLIPAFAERLAGMGGAMGNVGTGVYRAIDVAAGPSIPGNGGGKDESDIQPPPGMGD